jgi:hypothetical protein
MSDYSHETLLHGERMIAQVRKATEMLPDFNGWNTRYDQVLAEIAAGSCVDKTTILQSLYAEAQVLLAQYREIVRITWEAYDQVFMNFSGSTVDALVSWEGRAGEVVEGWHGTLERLEQLRKIETGAVV